MLGASNSSLLDIEDFIEYCYPESNLSCVKISHNVEARAVIYSILVFATIVTILGNSVVIISIAHFKQLHTPTNILVMSLALVDLLLGLTVMPFSMVRTVDGCWYFGEEFCYWHSTFDFLFTGASIFHLISIAADRHQAVCYPLHYPSRITLPVAGVMAALSWILATVYAFSSIGLNAKMNIGEYIVSVNCFGNCLVLISEACASICTCLFFIVPVCVMIGLYTQIFLVSDRHARTIEVTKKGRSDITSSTKISQKVKHEKKAAKTLGIVVGAFNACWMPYYITSLIDTFSHNTATGILPELFNWLTYINSTLNPIIYGLFYPWFRKTLYLIVTLKIFAPNSSDIKVCNVL